MGHNVEYLISLVDRMSGPAQKIAAHFKNVNTTVDRTKASVDRLGKAQGFNQLANSANRIPRSISDLNQKLKDLNAQLETTHSKKTFINLRKEIKATEQQLASLTGKMSGGMGGGIGSLLSKGLAYFGGFYAIQKAFTFMNDNLDAYDHLAKNRAMLRTGLISTRFSSGKNVEGLESQAVALERKTLFREDETMGAQSILLTFSKIRGKIYDEAIPAIQDMTTRLGGDLVQNAKILGKGLNDPAQSMMQLRRVGIQFTESQTKRIKELVRTGQLYQAQLMIINLLHEKFGGSAEAAAKAGIGATQQLANKWHSMKEAIGENWAPAINAGATSIGRLVTRFTDWVKVPISEKIQDEINKIRFLQSELANANLKEKERADLLRQLTEIDPRITEGINAQATDYKKLAENIDKVTWSLKAKIYWARKEALYTPEQAKQEAAITEEQMAGQYASDIATKYGFNKGKPEERIAKTLAFLKKFAVGYEKHIKIPDKSEAQLEQMGQDYYNLLSERNRTYQYQAKGIVIGRGLSRMKSADAAFAEMMGYSPNEPGGGSGGGTGGSGSDAGDEMAGISAGGSKATNITVNLKDLIGEMKLYTNSATEGGKKVEDIVTESLLRVLNSANRMGSQ